MFHGTEDSECYYVSAEEAPNKLIVIDGIISETRVFEGK